MNARHCWALLGGASLFAVVLAGCGPATPLLPEPTAGAPLAIAALQSPIETPTPTPTNSLPVPTDTPTATPVAPTPPPFCTPPPPRPPDATPPDNAVALEDYSFGEPQVIFTDSAPIDIIGWMPDGRHLLLARTAAELPRRIIEALDTQTGRTTRYAESDLYARDVAFPLDRGRGVAFFDLGEQLVGDVAPPNDLMASHGPGQAQALVRRFSGRSMAVDPHTASLVRYEHAPGGPPALPPQADLRVLSLPVDPYQWKYPKYFRDRVETGYTGDEFRVAVRPDGSLVAFISDPYLFLYDTQTEAPCEVDLGIAENGEYRSAWNAQWSPDGRFLAMRTTAAFPGSSWPFADLSIYDTLTGELRNVNGSPYRDMGSFSWSPNSRVVLARGRSEENRAIDNLLLIDALSGSYLAILPDQSFVGGSPSLFWNRADNIAIACDYWPGDPGSSIAEGRLCVVRQPAR